MFVKPSFTSNWKVRVVNQLGNSFRISIFSRNFFSDLHFRTRGSLPHEVLLGDVVDEILHPLLVAGQGVVIVVTIHTDLTQVSPELRG